MNKQIERKPANYVISRLIGDSRLRIYLTAYNLDTFGCRWSSNPGDANLFTSKIEARKIINCKGIRNADILCRPIIEEGIIVEEEETKEMDKPVIIQSHFYFKGHSVTMYVKKIDLITNAVKYTKDKKNARRFSCIENAEEFIKCYKPHSPQIVYCHDISSLDAPEYSTPVCYCAEDVIATTELMREICNMEREISMRVPEIKNVIFNNPATIVFWADGTKTVVKCQKDEIYDPEKGIAMAISKKALGNKYDYYNTIAHWLKKAPKMETSRFYCNGIEYTSKKAGE